MLWAIANLALFVFSALRYRADGPWVMLAHGMGGCLDLNGALVLLPVMRRLLHWLRLTAVGRFLPLDDALLIHRVFGAALFFLGLIHTAAHFMKLLPGRRGLGLAHANIVRS